MSKRKEKRAQEAQILKELDEAVARERAERGEDIPDKGAGGEFIPQKQEVIHCKRCKTKMEGGVCPVCGYKIYQPMTEERRKKIRTILTLACLGIFLVIVLITRL